MKPPDAHETPPIELRAIFKRWQKSTWAEVEDDERIFDPTKRDSLIHHAIYIQTRADKGALRTALKQFVGEGNIAETSTEHSPTPPPAYESIQLPGLFVFPSLLLESVQVALLNKLLHRDLSNPNHKTNLHLFYDIPYRETATAIDALDHSSVGDRSFFALDDTHILRPKNSQMHKPITITQMLKRKLRWITLGGQYDWTAKVYPDEEPPHFPPDIARLLTGYFPDVDAQAAIVNFYTPGDTLSSHRDVSEECSRPLISISIGCEALFMVANHDASAQNIIRLRSGDAVLMSGEARYAWHAVPKVFPNSCPQYLEEWPGSEGSPEFRHWKGWMRDKRINLNVRQIKD